MVGVLEAAMKTISSLTLAVGFSMLFACGEKEPSTALSAKSLPKPDTKDWSASTTETNSATVNAPAQPPLLTSNLAVADAIAKACGLTRPTSAPQFDFDSSDVQEDDKKILAELAKCLLTGPLAGKALSLTGRADPRGESEYNMTLGAHRASSVRSLLSEQGVPQTRLFVTSRGEMDASGNDELSWAKDRRVDIELR
jgi:peptidoglycan-associated lipoprotein